MRGVAQGDGRIIVMTIHQPSSQIFYQFDRLLLMASGKQAYFGPSADAMAKFEAMGLRCERQYNPADYLLDVLSDVKEQDRILASYATDPQLQKEIDSLSDRARNDAPQLQLNNRRTSVLLGASNMDPTSQRAGKWATNTWEQFTILTRRAFKQTKGDISSPIYFVQVKYDVICPLHLTPPTDVCCIDHCWLGVASNARN